MLIYISDKTRLKRGRKTVEQSLLEQIKKGEKIIGDSRLTLEELLSKKQLWEDYITLLAKRLFHESDCFDFSGGVIGLSETEEITREKENMKDVIVNLKSIINRLGLIEQLTIWEKLLCCMKKVIEFLGDISIKKLLDFFRFI